MSYSTVQKILNRHGMGTRYERWLRLEEKAQEEGIELNEAQLKFLEKQTPNGVRGTLRAANQGSCCPRIPSTWAA